MLSSRLWDVGIHVFGRWSKGPARDSVECTAVDVAVSGMNLTEEVQRPHGSFQTALLTPAAKFYDRFGLPRIHEIRIRRQPSFSERATLNQNRYTWGVVYAAEPVAD